MARCRLLHVPVVLATTSVGEFTARALTLSFSRNRNINERATARLNGWADRQLSIR
jgi:hypothetical protein